MKNTTSRLFILVLFAVFFGPAALSGETYLWDSTIGGPDRDIGRAVTLDNEGNVYVSGSFSGTVDFGGGDRTSAGGEDIFIVKFDRNGNYVWDRTCGDLENDDIAFSLDTDSHGNVYACGSFVRLVDFGGGSRASAGGLDIFVLKLDRDGGWIWDRTFGNRNNQTGVALTVDSEDNVIITGRYRLPLNFGGGRRSPVGRRDIFVLKLDTDGDYLWDRTYGGVSRDAGRRVAVDNNDNIYIVGNFENTIDFGGGERTEGDNEFYDAYLLELDSDGNYISDRTWGGAGEDANWGVAVNSDGSVYITGYFAETVNFGGGERAALGSSDISVVKFDRNLNYLWDRTYGGDGKDFGYDIAFLTRDHLFVTGSFEDIVDLGGGLRTSAGDKDMFILEFNSDGEYVWDDVTGGIDLEQVQGIFVDPSEGMYVTGFFSDVVDFGGGDRASNGSSDIFLVKYEAPIPTTVDINPNTLILGSKGRWVTCYIELVDEYDVRDVDISSIMLNNVVPVALKHGNLKLKHQWKNHKRWESSMYRWGIGDYDDDGIQDLMVKFDRSEIIFILDPGDEVPVLVSGYVGDVKFSGMDYIKVVDRPVNPLEDRGSKPLAEDDSFMAYPNPFNPSVRFDYAVSKSNRVLVQIFDARGGLVRTIEDGQRTPGTYSTKWNGKNGTGATVASGVYFCRLSIGSEALIRKLMLLR